MIGLLTLFTFWWTFFIFHQPFEWGVVLIVIIIRMLASILLFRDYSLSWSKSSAKTFLLKTMVYIVAFMVYMPIFYSHGTLSFFTSELFFYLFVLNFLVYFYYYLTNRGHTPKTKSVVIYGAGKAGIKLEEEFRGSEYKIRYFVDDSIAIQKRSIDGINILSKTELMSQITVNDPYDLLIIAMPNAPKERTKEVYQKLGAYFKEIKIFPGLKEMFEERPFSNQLQKLTVKDLLARHTKDLDKQAIFEFVKDKKILITGAGGSIGSELVRQCIIFEASQLILVDHSEYNLYAIYDELYENSKVPIIPVLQSVVDKDFLAETFEKYQPQIVIHAAAYKHVPMVEENIAESIRNNIIGTKNTIDLSIDNGVETFLLISTDKAVRPTNVMGTTKRICELYTQNVAAEKTSLVTVRFGNVLDSSGSVVPKFRRLIEQNRNLTVTDPNITRYFMLIPEACELVLQAASLGSGGEIFILDMGEPVKIVDLARKMIELSDKPHLKIEYIGLRPGEKLYEELLINESDMHTEYDSITVAAPTYHDIDKLKQNIEELLHSDDQIAKLKKIVPEFNHTRNGY